MNNVSTLGRTEPNLSQTPTQDIFTSKTLLEYSSGLLILLMHLGFTLIEAGSVRSKHTASIFVRNLTSLIISILTFWILGYAFSLGPGHFFLGYSHFGLYHLEQGLSSWFLHSTLASIPPVLVGLALAPRCHMTGLLTYTAVMTSLIYPLAVHWAWAEEGWLKVNGFTDVGGAGCLHVVVGVAAAVGVGIVGKRDRMEEGTQGHSLPLAAIGGGLVILGMLGKQVGLAASGEMGKQAGLAASGVMELSASSNGSIDVVGRAATSCIVGGAAGGLVGGVTWKLWRNKWSYYSCLNGWLAGMVSVSAGGHLLVTHSSWAALVVGLVGGILYIATVRILHASVNQGSGEEYNEKTDVKQDLVDDPARVVSVHLLPGLWGLVSVPLLTERGLLGGQESRSNCGVLVGWQVGGAATMAAWTAVLTLITMYPLLPMGKLRISPQDEKEGTDRRKTEESAYGRENEVAVDLNRSNHNLQKSYLNTRSGEFFKSTETLYASSQKLSGSSKVLAPKIVVHSPTMAPTKETILSQSKSPLYRSKEGLVYNLETMNCVRNVPAPPPMPTYLSMPNLVEEEKWPTNVQMSDNKVNTLQVPVGKKYASKSQESTSNNEGAKVLNNESHPEPLEEETKSDFVAELTVFQKQKAALKKQRKKLRPTSNTWTSPSLLQRGEDNLDMSSSSEGVVEAKVEKAIRNTKSFNYLHPGKKETVDEEKEKDVVFVSDDTLLEETEDVIIKIGDLTLSESPGDKRETLGESPEDKREIRLSSAATPAKNLFKELTNQTD